MVQAFKFILGLCLIFFGLDPLILGIIPIDILSFLLLSIGIILLISSLTFGYNRLGRKMAIFEKIIFSLIFIAIGISPYFDFLSFFSINSIISQIILIILGILIFVASFNK